MSQTTTVISFASILAAQTLPEAVKLEVKYYSYKDGEAVLHNTRGEALQRSKNIEKFVANQDDYDVYTELLRDAETVAFTEWYQGFRSAYSRYSKGVWDAMYARALALAERKNLRDTNVNDKTAEMFAGLVEYTDLILAAK